MLKNREFLEKIRCFDSQLLFTWYYHNSIYKLKVRTMYFYEIRDSKSIDADSSMIVGPYLLSRERLLTKQSQDGDFKKLSESDTRLLETATNEYTIYSDKILTLDMTYTCRDTLSAYEYEEVHQANKKAFDQKSWLAYMGITNSQHLNLLSGRTAVKNGVSRKLQELSTCNSYLLENSAFALSTLVVDGKAVREMTEREFGDAAINLFTSLRTSRHLGLTYFWNNRSHIDVMQTYIYLSTFDSRKNGKIITTWSESPEYRAFLASSVNHRPAKATSKSKQKRALLELMTKYKESNLTEEQGKVLRELMETSLQAMAFCGGTYTSEDIYSYMEKILGSAEGTSKSSLDFTGGADGLLRPEEDVDDDIHFV